MAETPDGQVPDASTVTPCLNSESRVRRSPVLAYAQLLTEVTFSPPRRATLPSATSTATGPLPFSCTKSVAVDGAAGDNTLSSRTESAVPAGTTVHPLATVALGRTT